MISCFSDTMSAVRHLVRAFACQTCVLLLVVAQTG